MAKSANERGEKLKLMTSHTSPLDPPLLGPLQCRMVGSIRLACRSFLPTSLFDIEWHCWSSLASSSCMISWLLTICAPEWEISRVRYSFMTARRSRHNPYRQPNPEPESGLNFWVWIWYARVWSYSD